MCWRTSEVQTAIDAAHAAMARDETDEAARLRFYERLADGELFLLLTQEPAGDDVTPQLLVHEGDSYVVAFDREERLARFAEGPAPYVALSGRALAGMLSEQSIGLALNAGIAPSSIFLPPAAMRWLAETLRNAPGILAAHIREVQAPRGLPEALLGALDVKLAAASGLARAACLAGVTYEGGGRGHLIGFFDAPEAAQGALTQAVAEALTFSGLEAGVLDVGFFAATEPMAERLARVGLRFELPDPVQPAAPRAAPGSDPAKPPILR